MGDSHSDSKSKPEPKVRRTTISKSGAITEQQIPLSSLKKDAMDLSENAQTLLVSRDAAMRITERAITTALANTWPNFLGNKEEPTPATSSGKKRAKAAPPKSNPPGLHGEAHSNKPNVNSTEEHSVIKHSKSAPNPPTSNEVQPVALSKSSPSPKPKKSSSGKRTAPSPGVRKQQAPEESATPQSSSDKPKVKSRSKRKINKKQEKEGSPSNEEQKPGPN